MPIVRGGLCTVCNRAAGSFGWFNNHYSFSNPRRSESLQWLCSRTCQDIVHGRRGVINPSKQETAAVWQGGCAGGAYLEEINKTDLAKLTVDEWETFLSKIVGGYCDALRQAAQQSSSQIRPEDMF